MFCFAGLGVLGHGGWERTDWGDWRAYRFPCWRQHQQSRYLCMAQWGWSSCGTWFNFHTRGLFLVIIFTLELMNIKNWQCRCETLPTPRKYLSQELDVLRVQTRLRHNGWKFPLEDEPTKEVPLAEHASPQAAHEQESDCNASKDTSLLSHCNTFSWQSSL